MNEAPELRGELVEARAEIRRLMLVNEGLRNALEKIASCECRCLGNRCVICVAKGALSGDAFKGGER